MPKRFKYDEIPDVAEALMRNARELLARGDEEGERCNSTVALHAERQAVLWMLVHELHGIRKALEKP